MKRIYSIVLAALAVIFTACSPEDFIHPSQEGLPNLDNIDAIITVDQELNQVTFTLPAGTKGIMPVWYFPDVQNNPYSTVNGLQKIYPKAGDYQVSMRLMNANGVSDEYKTYTFHIDNTQMDFTKYVTLLAGGSSESSKEWRMDADVDKHFGCGEPGTTGTNWWAANPHNKDGVGIYDNRIIFSSDYDYTYNPGTSGTMYVNCGISGLWPEYENADVDYNVPMEVTTTKFEFEVIGEDLYIVLPEKTPFLYVPNVEAWNTPRFRVESISGSALHLIADNGNIAWHYTLTSKAGAVAFSGFKYDSPFNLWKPIDDNSDYTTHFWYAPGWAQIADPGFAQQGAEYTFTLPEGTTDQWQAQCPIKPNSLHLTTDKTYDFSCIINSSNDIKGVTVKLTDVNTGDNFVFVERVDVKAYEDCIFYLSDVNNLSADADCELFFDFGGNPANTTVTVKNIVVKDHANDDGTILPDTPGEDTPGAVEWREADNLLTNAVMNDITYYYAPGWAQIADPETTVENGAYTLVLPEATSEQWQCQFTFHNTGIVIDPTKKYDFRVIISSSNTFNGATIKLTQEDNDNIYLTADRHEIKEAYTDIPFEFIGLSAEGIQNLKIVYDFAGAPAGTEITVKGMLLQEHQASADELSWDANAADNLWTADMLPNSFYYAPGWAQIADPTITQSGRSYNISLPAATSDQWQAQVTTETTISTSSADSYDFQVILTPNMDMKAVTVKLTMVGNDNIFFTADRHDLKAYEETPIRYTGMPGLDIDKVKLVLDFGGNADDCEVTVSDIILRKH